MGNSFISKIQKFFHTDKWWGKTLLIFFLYFLLVLFWLNVFVVYIYDGFKNFFNTDIVSFSSSINIITDSFFEIFKTPMVIFDFSIFYYLIVPILSFLYLYFFIFKVINITSLKHKIIFFSFHILFILIMLRILILSVVSNIHPNFF